MGKHYKGFYKSNLKPSYGLESSENELINLGKLLKSSDKRDNDTRDWDEAIRHIPNDEYEKILESIENYKKE